MQPYAEADIKATTAMYSEATPVTPKTPTQYLIKDVCDKLAEFLIEKNDQYGDSAVDPVRALSRQEFTAEDLILNRMDDKLSRLIRGHDGMESTDDVLLDFVGYWVLLQVVRRRADSE